MRSPFFCAPIVQIRLYYLVILPTCSFVSVKVMVNSRTFIAPLSQVSMILSTPSLHNYSPFNQAHDVNLHAQLYSAQKGKPTQIHVPTRCLYPVRQVGPQYPLVDSVLDEPQLQPYVHNCVVYVREGNQTHWLWVFFKWHRRLPYNISLLPFQQRMIAQGDFVVMRVGIYPGSVVNMRGRDTQISDWVIGR